MSIGYDGWVEVLQVGTGPYCSSAMGGGMTGAVHGASGREGAVAADPYPWPFDGDLRPANTALLVIDMQADFCGPGG